jgi:hypothetical protein
MAFTVGDAYLWATIYYLDSITDYRECVHENPAKPVQKPRHLPMISIITIVCFLAVLLALIITFESWS